MTNDRYFNRELSWLEFNQRVLDQARQNRHPLLERVKFLAITASNLDEFFMVRVGGLKLLDQSESDRLDIAGLTAAEQLELIRKRVTKMYQSVSRCLDQLTEELEPHGIFRVTPENLLDSERKTLLDRFQSETVSAISPIAFDNRVQLSMLDGSRLAVCVRLKNDSQHLLGERIDDEVPSDEAQRRPAKKSVKNKFRYVLIALGQSQERFWSVASDRGYRYILIEDVVKMFLSEFFDPETIVEATALRITRNGDLALEEDQRADLMLDMTRLLEARKQSDSVRMELERSTSRMMRKFLESTIGVDSNDVYLIDGPLALRDYFSLSSIRGFPQLVDEPWTPQTVPSISRQNIFKAIAASDRMLHHPYQSYEAVVDFVRTAANDPDVIAIKQTLYRAGKNSEIVQALATAAKQGKNVTAIVELKARFDEARNIFWARQLEQAGVDVIYGVRGLKTHAKMCLAVRKERTGIKRYVHFGTGNYNETTARLYGDISLFTCDEQLGRDAVHFFNAITGLSVPQPLVKLSAAPINLRERLLELIRIETEAAENGIPAEIIAKVNSLADKGIIDSLYDASQAGVKIRLNVRGICCLVPGQKKLSENIQVVSIVDRMLEHARIFAFRQGGEQKVLISSADWMGRNLNRRVELMVPIEDLECKSRLLRILETYFEDNVAATNLRPDGSYVAVSKKKRQGVVQSQKNFYQDAVEIFKATSNPAATVFETHKRSDSVN